MLGIDLSRELKSDYDICGADQAWNPKSPVKRFYKSDITDLASVMRVVAKARPNVVVHCAAWTDVDGCELHPRKAYRINSYGTLNVAKACAKAGAKLVFISTDFVFSGRKKTPYKETDRTSPLSVYGESKLRGERFVKRATDEYFIVRTSWLYGRYGKNFVDTIAAKGRTEKELRVVDDQVGSPTYTVNLAKAIHALLDRVQGTGCGAQGAGYGTYQASNTGRVSWYDYAREILKLSGSRAVVRPISSKELSRPARRPAMSVMNCEKLFGFTGYRMPGWKVALREYLIKGRG